MSLGEDAAGSGGAAEEAESAKKKSGNVKRPGLAFMTARYGMRVTGKERSEDGECVTSWDGR